eukprot:10857730-Ditylum_brightwellii.AAC.1
MTKHNATFVHVHGCSGKAMSKQNKITKLATACDACHDSAKNTKGEEYKFLQCLGNLEPIGIALDALDSPQLEQYHIAVLKGIAKICRSGHATEEFECLTQCTSAQLSFGDWKRESAEMMSSKGINIKELSTENFIQQIKKWYDKVPGARDLLCVGFVKALVAW